MSLVDALLLKPAAVNVWVAKRTDNIKGTGTHADPFDGSTSDRFDTLMNQLGPYTRIHLGPGQFQTRGYSEAAPGVGWQPKVGQKIVGSGIDVTTLQLVGAEETDGHYYVVGHDLATASPAQLNNRDFFDLSELTLDCNLNGQSLSPPALACISQQPQAAAEKCTWKRSGSLPSFDAALSALCSRLALSKKRGSASRRPVVSAVESSPQGGLLTSL